MADFHTSVIYFSLPSFPKSCKLIHHHDVIPRDVLLCNKTNDHHIRWGMQYDPNIENAEYAVCEPQVRRGLGRRAKSYDNLYLIFRTRYFRLGGSSRYLITGFYKIKKEASSFFIREAPVVHAESMHFVSTSDCIDVTKKIKEARAFRCCLTSNNPKWKQELQNWIKRLKKKPNRTNEYIEEINNLKSLYHENEFQGKQYPICESCKYYTSKDQNCPLVWRRCHYSISPHPANFMTNLSEYFRSLALDEKRQIT